MSLSSSFLIDDANPDSESGKLFVTSARGHTVNGRGEKTRLRGRTGTGTCYGCARPLPFSVLEKILADSLGEGLCCSDPKNVVYGPQRHLSSSLHPAAVVSCPS